MARPFSEIPVVPPVPADFPERRLPYLAEMAATYGPIFKLSWHTRVEQLYLIGPEANKFVLQTHREHFSNDRGWTPNIGALIGKGLINMDPPEHTEHRRMMSPAFAYAYMERYLPIMGRLTDERCRDWAERGEVDIYTEMRKVTFDVAAEALLGFPAGQEVDELREMFFTMISGLGNTNETPQEYIQRIMGIRQELSRRLLKMIAERRGRPENEQRDILSMMVNARDTEGEMLSDQQLLSHVNILLIAGHETSTTLASWLLYMLAANPEELAKVREELDVLLPDLDTPINHDRMRGMRRLGYALSETSRMYSPVAMVPRAAINTVEFGGYEIPADTEFVVALGGTHYFPNIFADPERFDPDRFAPPREEDKRTPYALAPFGGGPRICIGINFAQVEIRAMAAYILRRYDLTPTSPETTLPYYPSMLGTPKNGIPVRVQLRAEISAPVV